MARYLSLPLMLLILACVYTHVLADVTCGGDQTECVVRDAHDLERKVLDMEVIMAAIMDQVTQLQVCLLLFKSVWSSVRLYLCIVLYYRSHLLFGGLLSKRNNSFDV